MKTISHHLFDVAASLDGVDGEELRKALRAGEVRALWAKLVEQHILDHTNGVYIVKEDGFVIMHVYVDESIYAAELNNRRELIQLICNERFGEVINEFQIHISRGLMKQRHPYREQTCELPDQKPPIPLSGEEMELVNKACSCIDHPSVREQFEKAMIADMEWKKGNMGKITI